MDYELDFSFLPDEWPALAQGLWVTVRLAVAANIMGLTLGFGLCLLAMSRQKILRWPAMMFIEFFRCTPVLLQIVWFFYCVPFLFGVYFDPIPLGIMALGLNLTAFNAEAYRAGVQAVPRDHLDACVALGLAPWQRTLYVVLPQALRTAMPVLITQGISILQQSALVSIVAVGDLMYVSKDIATQNYRPLEMYSLVALIYFVVSLPIARLAHVMERRQEQGMRQ